uniref:Uncharacterized protein n=1 Tax=uncultured marine virus TaxID=186617 RepID=A0A0F7L5S0_9VIRU|nr:hypothetical protein [uncultured marine virus]
MPISNSYVRYINNSILTCLSCCEHIDNKVNANHFLFFNASFSISSLLAFSALALSNLPAIKYSLVTGMSSPCFSLVPEYLYSDNISRVLSLYFFIVVLRNWGVTSSLYNNRHRVL